MKLNITILILCTLFFTSCSSIIHKNFVKMAPYDIDGKVLYTYDMSTKILSKAKYLEYNGQFIKKNEEIVKPLKELDYKAMNTSRYEKDLKKMSCFTFDVQECIENTISSKNAYFEFEGKKEYILDENYASKIFEVVRSFNNLL